MRDHWPPSAITYDVYPAEAECTSATRDTWGWAEVFIALQLVWGVVLFVPGAQVYRTVIRATPYLLSGAALVYYFRQGKGDPLPRSTQWLIASFGLLLLNLLHDTAQWRAGGAQVVFQLCIAAPAFWMARSVRTQAHLQRVLWVFFAGNALGAVLGVLQVYFPNTFLPPEFSALGQSLNPNIVQSLTYVGTNGRDIIRPPGLSDVPSGAAVSGMMTMILGLTLASRHGLYWVARVGCLAAAAVGMTVLYLTQVRSLTMVAAAAVAVCVLLRLRQGRAVDGTLSLAAGVTLVIVGYVWALTVGGAAISERFEGLADERAFQIFQDQRGLFVRYTVYELLDQFPLGAGLGRWGMMQVLFGDPSLWQSPPIHVEIQLTGWLLDGGVPLWLLYGGALAAAARVSYRVAIRGATRVLQDAATTTLCVQLTLIVLCLTGPVFNTQLGIMFWALTGALFGAAYAPLDSVSEDAQERESRYA